MSPAACPGLPPGLRDEQFDDLALLRQHLVQVVGDDAEILPEGLGELAGTAGRVGELPQDVPAEWMVESVQHPVERATLLDQRSRPASSLRWLRRRMVRTGRGMRNIVNSGETLAAAVVSLCSPSHRSVARNTARIGPSSETCEA